MLQRAFALMLGGFAALALLAPTAHAADETSSGDKLRMLYSNQFTFTDDGLPVVTIELSNGKKRVELESKSGMVVRPDGDSGAAVRAGKRWTISLEKARPAKLREWTVVGRFHPDESSAIERELSVWKSRGHAPKTFEIGTLFGVAGAVLDSRESLVAIAPVSKGRGKAKSTRIAKRFDTKTSVHIEIVRLPRGTVVARSGSVTISNPSVIWFSPADSDGTIQVKGIEVGGGGSQLATRTETRRYFGSVFATVGKDGKLVVVNAVSTDRLLAGIVPSEIFASAPAEALRAQAVAARTELLEKLGRRHFGDPFLLCSTQQCQVYSGAGKEHPRTTAAVKATRGMVLMGRDKRLVDARYSASCGGHTENKEDIWGGERDQHLRGFIDAIPGTPSAAVFAKGVNARNLRAFLDAPAAHFYEGSTRYGKGRFRWSKTLTTDELTRRVAAKYPTVGRLKNLEPLARGVSGRIKKVRIYGIDGTVVASGDLHLRRLFGGLRSSLFVVEKVGDSSRPTAFRFRGAGFGHGVGMCQVGAIGMAEHKKSYEKILRHYYRGASLKRLY